MRGTPRSRRSKHLSPDAAPTTHRPLGLHPQPAHALQRPPQRWREAAYPGSSRLSGIPQERALQLGPLCGVAGAVRKCAPWWVTSSPRPGAQEARCGCKPSSVQPRTLGKDAKALTGPSANWPRHSCPPQAPTQGPRAATPRGRRPGLELESTQPAHPLHRCRGLGPFAWTQRLSTCSSLSLPLSRNIEVTLLMPG